MDTGLSFARWIGSLKLEDTRDIKIWPRTPFTFYFGKNASRLERIFSLDDRKAGIRKTTHVKRRRSSCGLYPRELRGDAFLERSA